MRGPLLNVCAVRANLTVRIFNAVQRWLVDPALINVVVIEHGRAGRFMSETAKEFAGKRI